MATVSIRYIVHDVDAAIDLFEPIVPEARLSPTAAD